MTDSIQSGIYSITMNNKETYFPDFLAFASEVPENLEEVFPRYYIHSDKFSMLQYSTT